MNIDKFTKVYFEKEECERDINEWAPILDRFVKNICSKYTNLGEFDDLYQTAWIACINAIKLYDISKGTKFSTYCYRAIVNEFNMLSRVNKRRGYTVSLSEPINEEKDIFLEDTIADDHYDDLDMVVVMEKYQKMLSSRRVTDTDRKILILSNEGYTQKEIAEKLGYGHQSMISRELKKCLNIYKK